MPNLPQRARFLIDLMPTSDMLFLAQWGGPMARIRAVFCVVLSLLFLVSSTLGASAPAVGTITSASRANVGTAAATVGTTVFVGDRLVTQQAGILQVRAGAARMMLSASSAATVADSNGTMSATLQQGTLVFSTANSKAFLLHAATAEIRPETDAPTVAQVTYVNSKELVVRATRGSVAITVDGETQFVPEATAYRVILDPDSYLETAAAGPAPQGAQGAGAGRNSRPPRHAGRSRFLLLAIIVTSVATGVALYEALQSPDKP